MDKKPLIAVSICAVILLILASLTNVVGYQTVQSSNLKTINKEANQKELLFQTIVDIANNKEIQQVILKSQISREGFFNPDVKFPILNTPVFTKNQLKQMYFIGLLLSKIISKSKMHSLLEQHQMIPQGLQKEIPAVIENDVSIKGELTQLSNSNCNCGDNSGVTVWHFPVICTILAIILFFLTFIVLYLHVGTTIFTIIGTLFFEIFKCNGI